MSAAEPRPSRRKEPRQSARRRRFRRRYHAHSIRYLWGWKRKVVFATALLAIAGGLAISADIYGFYHHSNQVGSTLIRTQERADASAKATGKCVSSFPAEPGTGTGVSAAAPGPALAANAAPSAPPGATPTVYALLKAPSIGLVAPVVDGVGDAQLSVAVGHVPASSWPGTEGTSVLAAHDVTWFSSVDQLSPGQQLSVVTPCQTFVYTVDDHQVVSASTPIFQTEQPRLVLITCYPTDALFLTSQRYVVDAYLTAVTQVPVKTPKPTSVEAPAVPTSPAVPAPPALAMQGLDLAHNSAPMGSLTVTGSPSTSWQQSTAPLNDTSAVVALYFAAIRSAEQGQGDWWVAIAPTVAYASASHLVGATIVHNDSVLSPSLNVTGVTLNSVSLVTEPVLIGNDSPGIYRIEMTADVVNNQLIVNSWSMQRMGS